MEKELRLQIERLQEDKNYNDQMYREVRAHGLSTPIISRLETIEFMRIKLGVQVLYIESQRRRAYGKQVFRAET